MKISRRQFGRGAAALLASPYVIGSARAEETVIMGTSGGANARMFREVFAAPFTKATGIKAIISELPDPTAAIAAAQGRPQHNVIIAASYQAANLASKGLIEELTEDDIPNVKHVPEQYRLRDASGRLLGMPVYFIYLGLAYNANLVKPEDFPSWEALADPKWKEKVSITRPVFLAPYDLTLFAKIRGGDEKNVEPGIPLLKAVSANAIGYYTSMSSLLQQLSLGEVVAAPFYSGQIQAVRKAGQKEINIALPKEGGLVLSYVLALPKGAPNRAAALRYINDAIDPVKQIGAATAGWLPLSDNVKLPDDVNSLLTLPMEEVRERNWSPNWQIIAENVDQRIRMVERVLDSAR